MQSFNPVQLLSPCWEADKHLRTECPKAQTKAELKYSFLESAFVAPRMRLSSTTKNLTLLFCQCPRGLIHHSFVPQPSAMRTSVNLFPADHPVTGKPLPEKHFRQGRAVIPVYFRYPEGQEYRKLSLWERLKPSEYWSSEAITYTFFFSKQLNKELEHLAKAEQRNCSWKPIKLSYKVLPETLHIDQNAWFLISFFF